MTSRVARMPYIQGLDNRLSGRLKMDFAHCNTVAGAAKHIRMGFLKKVYGLLSIQLLMTTLVGGVCLCFPTLKGIFRSNPKLILIAAILSLVLLIALDYWRKDTSKNLILLAMFTVVQAFLVGVIVSFNETGVVFQAFLLTAGVVVGLTAFTFESTKDFSGWFIGLLAGLCILLLGGFFQVFIGGEMVKTGMAVFGALIFSGLIICDTQMIMHRLSPEDYIVATLELYLDIINLFIEILKIMDKFKKD